MPSSIAGATVTELVAANAQRHSLILTNTGSANVYLGQDDTVTSGNGILIVANGTLSEDSGGTTLYKGPYYGLTGQGTTSVVTYWERTRS